MRVKKGSLFVLSAPSGAGKTTLCQRLCATLHGIHHSVSYTTRQPRPGEINDVHYSFVDRDTFMAMIAEDMFVEWAEVHGNYYGTSRKRIEELTGEGIDVILDIDVQGALQIKEKLSSVPGGCVFVFVLPPSMDVLRKRLRERMSDTDEVIRIRLRNAVQEIREYKSYDYVIINDIIDDALQELLSIVLADRIRQGRIDHEWVYKNFLEEAV
ncbi:MAG: guanylate kinase [Nitrospirae bacterium]|nr:guanylate kinase [Nitrospirota bacterium]